MRVVHWEWLERRVGLVDRVWNILRHGIREKLKMEGERRRGKLKTEVKEEMAQMEVKELKQEEPN